MTAKVLVDEDQWVALTGGKRSLPNFEEVKVNLADTFGGNYKPPSPLLDAPLVRRGPGKVGRSEKSVKTWLSYYGKSNGAANTAFAFNFDVQPNKDSDFASYQALFDEMRVLTAEIIWNVNFTTPPTALANQTPNVALAYEPAWDGTFPFTAVNQVLHFQKFSLLNAANVVGTGGTSAYLANPQAISPGGALRFSARMPNTPTQSNTVITLSTGMWRPTLDGANYYWGSFIGYAAQGGATSVLQVEAFVRMRVEFRCRR